MKKLITITCLMMMQAGAMAKIVLPEIYGFAAANRCLSVGESR